MDRMKTFFKYFIIVLAFYIISNLIIANIMKPQLVQANSEVETVANAEFDWEEISHDPMFWFIALAGLIVTLP